MDKSIQLKYNGLAYQPNPKLLVIQSYVTIYYNLSGGKILDATGPAVYKTVEENPIHLRRMAQEEVWMALRYHLLEAQEQM